MAKASIGPQRFVGETSLDEVSQTSNADFTPPSTVSILSPEPAEWMRHAPLLLNNAEWIDSLRQAFERSNFTEAGMLVLFGSDMAPHLKRVDLPLYERRLLAGGTLGTLIKLFVLQLPVRAEAASEALAPLSLVAAADLGVIRLDGANAHARVTISFCEGLWLVHDCLKETESGITVDHVLGTSPATMTLAKLVVRRPVSAALDVGTGCGVQALLCARHSQRVIATDTNPRALGFTAFNARLNRLENVECRQGSLFEPVAGFRFDLIVCNPPFVISPESEYLFRDSGLPGDKLSEAVLRAVPGYMAEGGFASVLCSWTHAKSEDWSTRLKDWVSNNGCDSWLLHGITQDPLSYAAGWIRGSDPATYGESLDRWQDYYARLGIQTLSLGAVILRRRTLGANWLRADELSPNAGHSCSDHILRIVQVEDHLAALADASRLFDQTYRMPQDLQVRQTFVPRAGKLALEKVEVELCGGLRFKAVLGPSAVQLLSLCDGRRTLEQVAGILMKGAVQAEPQEQTRHQVTTLVQHLLSSGFLVPSEPAPICESLGQSVLDPPLNPYAAVSAGRTNQRKP